MYCYFLKCLSAFYRYVCSRFVCFVCFLWEGYLKQASFLSSLSFKKKESGLYDRRGSTREDYWTKIEKICYNSLQKNLNRSERVLSVSKTIQKRNRRNSTGYYASCAPFDVGFPYRSAIESTVNNLQRIVEHLIE